MEGVGVLVIWEFGISGCWDCGSWDLDSGRVIMRRVIMAMLASIVAVRAVNCMRRTELCEANPS